MTHRLYIDVSKTLRSQKRTIENTILVFLDVNLLKFQMAFVTNVTKRTPFFMTDFQDSYKFTSPSR